MIPYQAPHPTRRRRRRGPAIPQVPTVAGVIRSVRRRRTTCRPSTETKPEGIIRWGRVGSLLPFYTSRPSGGVMRSERLRVAMTARGLTCTVVAERVAVDPNTSNRGVPRGMKGSVRHGLRTAWWWEGRQIFRRRWVIATLVA